MNTTIAPTVPLDVRNLRVTYGSFVAVDDVSLSVAPGEVYGLIGPNGSGKSSTFGAIVGLLDAADGEVRLSGEPAGSVAARERLGYAPDTLPLPEALTAVELLAFYSKVHSTFDEHLARSLLSLLGLDSAADQLLGSYSHGMHRKIRLICALSHRPALVVMDEPFNGLDPVAAILARDLMCHFAARGGAALVATHDLRGAEQYCSRVGVLNHGRLVAEGSPADLRSSYHVESLEEVFIAARGLDDTVDEQRRLAASAF